jgi:hypothetical protein
MTYDKVLVVFYFIISTYILSKLTLKSNRAETGEQFEIWKWKVCLLAYSYFVQFWNNCCNNAYFALDRIPFVKKFKIF